MSNRVIKFRIFNTVTNKFIITDKYAITTDGKLAIYTENYTKKIDPDKILLSQFTCLHDKNGKEIYEGDVLERASIKIIVMYDTFKNCGCCGLVEGIGYNIEDDSKLYQIIGNIFENPELLQEARDNL